MKENLSKVSLEVRRKECEKRKELEGKGARKEEVERIKDSQTKIRGSRERGKECERREKK